jgi:ABC-2 type transport system ATP-binding protein
LPQIMDILRSQNAKTEKISITKPSLDDVFLKYAGTRLEKGGRIGEVTQVRRMIRKG